MSTNAPFLPQSGPDAGDVARIWATIEREFMEKFAVVTRPVPLGGERFGLAVELVSDSVQDINGHMWEHVWSKKVLTNPGYLISIAQLYDLLIVAYRTMDKYFAEGEAFAPPKRQK